MTKTPVNLTILSLLMLTACSPPTATRYYNSQTTLPAQRVGAMPASPPTVYEPSMAGDAPVREIPPNPTVKATASPPVAGDSTAVLALLQEANANSSSGQWDNAAASLERGIRIQPRNPQLWQKLAEVRLQQHQPGLAEDLAKKSNLLAKDDKALTQKNWGIIADARRQKGDTTGAAEADAKAKP